MNIEIVKPYPLDRENDPTLDQLVEQVRDAERRFRPYLSLHEAYGIMKEEVDEFWDLVKKKERDRDRDALRAELIDIMCVCWRAVRSLGLEDRVG